MPEKVKVLRRKPKVRSGFGDLCGVIYATLTADSYVHVGSSEIFTVNENLLAKLIKSGERNIKRLLQAVELRERIPFNVSGGRPVIPGSSIKGNIRSRLELSFRPKDGYVRSCFIRASRPLIKEPLKGTSGWRHFKIWGKVLFEDRESPCDFTRMGKVCLICDLFGTAGLKSLIDFGDFVGEGDARDMLEPLSLEYGINLLAAKPGSKFNGRILFHNLSPSELGLLFIGMKVGKSVLLGRLKYRHVVSGKTFGKARYDVKAIEFLRESRDFEVGGLRIKGGDRIEGEELDKLINGLMSLANEEFKDEIVDVDEVAIVERISKY
ncbi:MAG: RAMP superfamily CRISPR-associated protein [Candidatus Bathyarchaeia archaeon]